MTFTINKFTLIFPMKNLRSTDLFENTFLFSLNFFPSCFCNYPLKRCGNMQDRKRGYSKH